MGTKLEKKSDKPIFEQIISIIPTGIFKKNVSKWQTDKYCSVYFIYDQIVSTMFGQLNRCLTLREISMGIDQSPEFLSDIGLKQSPAKSSMSYGNEKRNCKVFEELYYSLLNYFNYSLARRPEYKVIVHISEAKVSDRRGVDDFRYSKDTIVVDDRGYFDCKLFRTRIDDQNWFVIVRDTIEKKGK
jgi:hypothetical protein